MTRRRNELESFVASRLPKNYFSWVLFQNRFKILLGVLLALGVTTLQADEIDVCLKNPKTVWDMDQWKCRPATKEELPYAKA